MIDRITKALLGHRKVAIAVLLVSILAVGSGVAHLQEEDTLGSMEVGVEEERTLDYVQSNFTAGPENETVTQVVLRDDDALDKETLLASLRLQREIRANESVAPTLQEDRPTVGVANVVARTAVRIEQRGGIAAVASSPSAESASENGSATIDSRTASPSLDRQITAIESMSQRQLDALISRLFAGDAPDSEALALMPADYEPGSTDASATMVVVFQEADRPVPTGNAPEGIVDAQTTVQDIASETTDDSEAIVVGPGVITAETQQARSDTFRMVGPLALLFVLVTLAVVYRDAVDLLLSLAGIVLVQVWTFGMLGWLGISFNPILIAVPVLLVGLSIDYGVHVFTRYREQRVRGPGPDGEVTGPAEAMRTALAGVGVALLWVTVTTVVGFLSNLVSPMAPIRELGIIAAIGIVGSLVVFGGLLPPLKAELDSALERQGRDRVKPPIGTGGGWTGRLLAVGASAARRAPLVVILLTLLVTGAATVAATDVSTSFQPEDNIPEEAPGWTERLPETVQPAEYTARENLRFVNERFVRHDAQAEFLLRDDVTDPATLERIDDAESVAAEQAVSVTLADGDARTTSPLSVIESVAARDGAFAETVAAADTDGNGVPDRNLSGVYDHLYEVAPDRASSVLHRDDGEYRAARMAVSVVPDAPGEAVIEEMNRVAVELDGEGTDVALSGDPVLQQVLQEEMLETVLTSLFATLLVVVGLIALVYRRIQGSASLGIVTLAPVAFVVSWIVATMTAIGYPLSVLTSVVASITIGIGIDYSIHVSERFSQELDGGATPEQAITTTVRGTGSALFGSAATTAIGFGVLGFALLPPLQQFGTITAIMIGYAFLASVLVLPSMLVLWARHVRQNGSAVEGLVPGTPEESPSD